MGFFFASKHFELSMNSSVYQNIPETFVISTAQQLDPKLVIKANQSIDNKMAAKDFQNPD